MNLEYNASLFRKIFLNKTKYKLFLITNLPMALLAGITVKAITQDFSQVTIPFKYLTKNPFKSIYFACLAMAAELSGGVLAMSYIYKSNPSVSMLPVKMEADFTKKATGTIVFQCEQGEEIKKAVSETLLTGDVREVRLKSTGIDTNGDQVAMFYFTWSFKARIKNS